MRDLILKIKILLFSLLMSGSTQAAVFFVATDGNDSNTGSIDNPWKTIDKANKTVKAGDTVFIRGGTYSGEQIYPMSNGTATNRITYRNYGDEQVRITDVGTAILLNNRTYITVSGSPNQNIIIENCDHGATANYAHHIILSYIDFGVMRNFTSSRGINIGAGSTFNWIHHCEVHEYGYYSSRQDYGDMLYIGSSPAEGNACNLIENCHIYHGGHVPFKVNGRFIVVRNNYLHNEEWYPKENPEYGNRNMSTLDYEDSTIEGWVLIEGNRFAFTGIPSDAVYSSGIQHCSHDCIIRKNMFFACKGPGLKIEPIRRAPDADNNYVYPVSYTHLRAHET